MKSFSRLLLAPLVILSLHGGDASAASFSELCPDVMTCGKAVSALLDQKYLFDPEIQGTVKATPNLELTKENAELLFTSALHMNGFTRVPLSAPKLFRIMRNRDARDSAIPMVTADANNAPKLPETWDLYTMKYQATHPKTVEDIARQIRSFMPADSRIVPIDWTGVLLVSDAAPNLKKAYDLIRLCDQKASVPFKFLGDETAPKKAKKSE